MDNDLPPASTTLLLTALAHPLRARLLDLLAAEGSMTASMMAERTGQLVGNISHHLKMLARAELIEEDTARARNRRERWWGAVPGRRQWQPYGQVGSASSAAIGAAADAVNRDRHFSQLQAWQVARSGLPDWERVAFSNDAWLVVTPDELAEIGEEIQQVIARWAARHPDDGTDRSRAFVFAHGFPAEP